MAAEGQPPYRTPVQINAIRLTGFAKHVAEAVDVMDFVEQYDADNLANAGQEYPPSQIPGSFNLKKIEERLRLGMPRETATKAVRIVIEVPIQGGAR